MPNDHILEAMRAAGKEVAMRDARQERMDSLRQVIRGNPDVVRDPVGLTRMVPHTNPLEVTAAIREFRNR
jgi:hypothetical protein